MMLDYPWPEKPGPDRAETHGIRYQANNRHASQFDRFSSEKLEERTEPGVEQIGQIERNSQERAKQRDNHRQ